MSMQRNRGPSLLSSLGVLCLSTLAATAQDSIAQMCETATQVAPEYGNNCECALTALKNEISGDQFGIYADVGNRYFENLAGGLDRANAWDAAAKSIGEDRGMSLVEVLEITNPIGRLHAKAIKGCAS